MERVRCGGCEAWCDVWWIVGVGDDVMCVGGEDEVWVW